MYRNEGGSGVLMLEPAFAAFAFAFAFVQLRQLRPHDPARCDHLTPTARADVSSRVCLDCDSDASAGLASDAATAVPTVRDTRDHGRHHADRAALPASGQRGGLAGAEQLSHGDLLSLARRLHAQVCSLRRACV
jgi:hypothetical protein